MRRPLIEKPIRHAPRHHHRASTPRGSWWVPSSHAHHNSNSSSGTRALVALLPAPAESRLFATQFRQRLLDNLGDVYDGHAVHIRDIDDWDTWEDKTAELDLHAEVTELLK